MTNIEKTRLEISNVTFAKTETEYLTLFAYILEKLVQSTISADLSVVSMLCQMAIPHRSQVLQ